MILSCWEVWYDEVELLQTSSMQNFTSGTLVLQNNKINGWPCISYTHLANKSPNSTCPCRILWVQVFGWKWRAITPFDPRSKSAIQSRVVTQSSHELEGPLAKQTDVLKVLARGITKGTFLGASRTKAVTRGWAHWSADQCNPPPTFSLVRRFLVASQWRFKIPPLQLLVNPLYKYEGGS